MPVLCDTCHILMLIRIAPEMFIDERFNCYTIAEVREEIFRTQKFKLKYPWRMDYKGKIIPIRIDSKKIQEIDTKYKLISNMIDSGVINRKGRFADLSRVDKRFVAYSIALGLDVATSDADIIDFAQNEFDKVNYSALCLLNTWIRSGLLSWDTQMNSYIEDWNQENEPVQPSGDIEQFEQLVGLEYLGP